MNGSLKSGVVPQVGKWDSGEGPPLGEVHKIIEKLESARRAQDVDLIYALFEELLWQYNIKEFRIPRIKLAGMESVGKSTVNEAILQLPINYSALNRATVAPVFFSLQKDESLKTEYHCIIQSSPSEESRAVKPERIEDELKKIMVEIKNGSKYRPEPVLVKILCRNPKTRSLSFIDLPGVIKTDTEEGAEDVVSGLWEVTEQCLRQNASDDYILLLHDINNNPSHLDLAERIRKIEGIRTENIIPVASRADHFITNKDYCDPRSPEALAWLNSVHKYFGSVPFWTIALYDSSARSGGDLQFRVKKMKGKIDENTQDLVHYMAGFLETQPNSQLAQELYERTGFDKLLETITRRRNEALMKACKSLPGVFAPMLVKERREEARIRTAMRNTITYATDREMLFDFAHHFSKILLQLFEAKLSRNIEEQINQMTKAKFSLKEELRAIAAEGISPFPIQDEVLPGLSLSNMGRDEEVIEHAEEASSHLFVGYQRIERLASEMRLRITALEIAAPTNELLRNNMPPNYRCNIKDLNGAVGQLSARVFGCLFVDQACEFVESRIASIMKSLTLLALEIVFSTEDRKFDKISPIKMSAVVPQLAEKIAYEAVKSIKHTVMIVFGGYRAESAENMEKRACFMHGNDTNNPTPGSMAQAFDRYDKNRRMEALSRKHRASSEERVACSVSEPTEEEYNRARFIFNRMFTNYREKFGQDYLPDLLLGGVEEQMKDGVVYDYLVNLMLGDVTTSAKDLSTLYLKQDSSKPSLATQLENIVGKGKMLESIIDTMREVTAMLDQKEEFKSQKNIGGKNKKRQN